MALVTIRINGYAHPVGCEDGQEAHLQAMAAEVERRIDSIKALGSQSGESRLLTLAALMMADEIHDLRAAAAAKSEPSPAVPQTATADPDLGRRLLTLARRAEEIAAGIERA